MGCGPIGSVKRQKRMIASVVSGLQSRRPPAGGGHNQNKNATVLKSGTTAIAKRSEDPSR
jgi:hypothetical protein